MLSELSKSNERGGACSLCSGCTPLCPIKWPIPRPTRMFNLLWSLNLNGFFAAARRPDIQHSRLDRKRGHRATAQQGDICRETLKCPCPRAFPVPSLYYSWGGRRERRDSCDIDFSRLKNSSRSQKARRIRAEMAVTLPSCNPFLLSSDMWSSPSAM